MSGLEILIVAALVTLAVAYVIFRAQRKQSRAGGCEGQCGCGKAASTQADRRR